MNDKLLHFAAGMVFAVLARGLFGAGAGMVAATVVGALKEVYDHFTGGDVSGADFLATVAGGLAVEAGFLVGEL